MDCARFPPQCCGRARRVVRYPGDPYLVTQQRWCLHARIVFRARFWSVALPATVDTAELLVIGQNERPTIPPAIFHLNPVSGHAYDVETVRLAAEARGRGSRGLDDNRTSSTGVVALS